MDKETLEVIHQLPYFNPNVTNELDIKCLLPNALVYIYGNKLKILPNDGGMLIIDINNVIDDIAPFCD